MSKQELVVARYRSGRIVKGHTANFHPNHPTFRIKTTEGEDTRIKTGELKAVFFVKDLEGDKSHRKSRCFTVKLPADAKVKQIAVLFKDGEVLTGYIESYTPLGKGFFVVPSDKKGNNLRAFVLADAINHVAIGDQAGELAQTTPQRTRRLWAA
jgi:hypothetical protein